MLDKKNCVFFLKFFQDVVDSNSIHHAHDLTTSTGHHEGTKAEKSYSSATIIKRRHPDHPAYKKSNSRELNLINIDYEDESENKNDLQPEQQQYQDILDVQVIAKMQEESKTKKKQNKKREENFFVKK